MKQKTPNLSAETRAQISETLPLAIEKAINAYQNFIDDGDDNELSVTYKNKQSAAKAGLAHIELLMKLVFMIDGFDEGKDNNILDLIAKAKDELEEK